MESKFQKRDVLDTMYSVDVLWVVTGVSDFLHPGSQGRSRSALFVVSTFCLSYALSEL